MKIALALVVALAGAAPIAAQVGADSREITEGSKAAFTIVVTFDPAKEVALAYFTEDDAPFDVPSGTPVRKESPPAARQDVGRIYRANVRVFLKDDPNDKALYESAKTKIPELLKTRKEKIAALQGLTLQVLAADDAAFAALSKGRKSAADLIEKGKAEADKKAVAAIASAWKGAETTWKKAADAIAKWKTLRDEIKSIDDQLNAALGLDAWPDPCADPAPSGDESSEESGDMKLMAAVKVKTGAPWVTVVELRFLADEYATSVGNLSIDHEIVFARPHCSWKLVRAESSIPAQVAVVKGAAEDRLAIEAEFARLVFTPGAAASDAPHAVEIRLHADAETKVAAALPGANVDFTFDALLRHPDADAGKRDFSYDDPRSKALDKCLLIYVRGSLAPAVSRYAAFAWLQDGTYFEVSELEDSHQAAPTFVNLSWRRPSSSDPQKGTVEFAIRVPKPAGKDQSVKVADYSPDLGGRFVFAFAYLGLPSVNSRFGAVKEMKMFRRDATPVGTAKEFRPFFNVAVRTHPVVDGLGDDARKLATDATNYLYYYSEDAAGDAAPAVAGLRFLSTPVNGKTVAVFAGGVRAGQTGTMGLTETKTDGYKITLFSTRIANLWRSGNSGLQYTFNEERQLEFYNPEPNNGDGKWVKQSRTLNLNVDKRFVHLVAHVWRHELRHVEQFEGLAGAGRDEDKDRVGETQEDLNNTSPNDPESWPNFPISASSTRGDNEVDCELAAEGVMGDADRDWGVVFDGDKKAGKGSQWQE
ncbi:MAG: hypothetical protein HYY17_03280 [Planctomycetes bacterium]|nr:hypothetical protein [Planctomycetota bacterium]